MVFSVVNQKGVSDKFRRNLASSCPCFDSITIAAGFLSHDFLHYSFVYIWSFFNTSTHNLIITNWSLSSCSFFSARYIYSNVLSCFVFVRLLCVLQMSLDSAYRYLIVLLLRREDVISDSVRLPERSVGYLYFLIVLLYRALRSLNQYSRAVRQLRDNQVELFEVHLTAI